MSEYVPLVRKYSPAGYHKSYWVGGAMRLGGKRATDLCAHQHATEGEARTCAENLTAIRNKQSASTS